MIETPSLTSEEMQDCVWLATRLPWLQADCYDARQGRPVPVNALHVHVTFLKHRVDCNEYITDEEFAEFLSWQERTAEWFNPVFGDVNRYASYMQWRPDEDMLTGSDMQYTGWLDDSADLNSKTDKYARLAWNHSDRLFKV